MPRRHIDAKARGVPVADALAQRLQARAHGVLRQAVAYGALGRLATERRGGETGSPMLEDHRLRVPATSRPLPARLELHHVKVQGSLARVENIMTLRLMPPGRTGLRETGAQLALPAALSASTSAARSCGARPFKTPLTYLRAIGAAEFLGQLDALVDDHAPGHVGQCWNS